MSSDPALETLAKDQKRWSTTANQVKKEIDRSRLAVLTLAIAGATLETLGAQIHASNPDRSVVVGYIGAAALAVIAVIKQWKLGKEHIQAWILARSAAESFKREMYLYRASAGPYTAGNPSQALLDRRDQILGKVKSVQSYVVEPDFSAVKIPGPLDANAYIAERVNGQVDWFRGRAARAARVQSLFDGIQFVLSIIGALLGAALAMTGGQAYGAWVAVITTIIASLGAHAAAQRFGQLAVSYRATADRLEGIAARFLASKGDAHELVERCEAALLDENQGWIAGADEMMKQPGDEPAAISPGRMDKVKGNTDRE
jgi:hypothetical protein